MNEETTEYKGKRIYIDLDSLFDTRLAILSRINPEVIPFISRNDYYRKRERDNWGEMTQDLISDAVFEEHWNARDRSVLVESRITGIFMVLATIANGHMRAVSEGVVENQAKLFVNCYPYLLTDEEQMELSDLIRMQIGLDIEIEFDYMRYEEITPEWFHLNASAIVMYEFHKWIKDYSEALSNRPLKSLTFIAPKLFEKDPGKISEREKKNQVDLLKSYLMYYLDLQYIDAKWFSIFNPKDK